MDTTRGGEPSWVTALRQWPNDFQRSWQELVAYMRKAGTPRGIARYAAYLTLEEHAQSFMSQPQPDGELGTHTEG